jgi:hypothetical protein
MIKEQLEEINVVKLNDDCYKMLEKTQILTNLTHESICLHNLLSLLCLLTR